MLNWVSNDCVELLKVHDAFKDAFESLIFASRLLPVVICSG